MAETLSTPKIGFAGFKHVQFRAQVQLASTGNRMYSVLPSVSFGNDIYWDWEAVMKRPLAKKMDNVRQPSSTSSPFSVITFDGAKSQLCLRLLFGLSSHQWYLDQQLWAWYACASPLCSAFCAWYHGIENNDRSSFESPLGRKVGNEMEWMDGCTLSSVPWYPQVVSTTKWLSKSWCLFPVCLSVWLEDCSWMSETKPHA